MNLSEFKDFDVELWDTWGWGEGWYEGGGGEGGRGG